MWNMSVYFVPMPKTSMDKYYNITEQGRQFLQALETSWEELTTAIEILKAPHTPQ